MKTTVYQMIAPQVSVLNYLLLYVPYREYVEDNCLPDDSTSGQCREYVEDNCLPDDSTSGQCIQLFTPHCGRQSS